jgi:hypothetical protein
MKDAVAGLEGWTETAMRKARPRSSAPFTGLPANQAAQPIENERTARSIDGCMPVTRRYAAAMAALSARDAFFPTRRVRTRARREARIPTCWPERARIWRQPDFLNASDSPFDRRARSPVMRAVRNPDPEKGMRDTAFRNAFLARARNESAREGNPRLAISPSLTIAMSPLSGGRARTAMSSPVDKPPIRVPGPPGTKMAAWRRAPPSHRYRERGSGSPETRSTRRKRIVPPPFVGSGGDSRVPPMETTRSFGIPNQGLVSMKETLADTAARTKPKPMAASFLPARRLINHAAPVRGKNEEEKPESADPRTKAMRPAANAMKHPGSRSAMPRRKYEQRAAAIPARAGGPRVRAPGRGPPPGAPARERPKA